MLLVLLASLASAFSISCGVVSFSGCTPHAFVALFQLPSSVKSTSAVQRRFTVTLKSGVTSVNMVGSVDTGNATTVFGTGDCSNKGFFKCSAAASSFGCPSNGVSHNGAPLEIVKFHAYIYPNASLPASPAADCDVMTANFTIAPILTGEGQCITALQEVTDCPNPLPTTQLPTVNVPWTPPPTTTVITTTTEPTTANTTTTEPTTTTSTTTPPTSTTTPTMTTSTTTTTMTTTTTTSTTKAPTTAKTLATTTTLETNATTIILTTMTTAVASTATTGAATMSMAGDAVSSAAPSNGVVIGAAAGGGALCFCIVLVGGACFVVRARRSSSSSSSSSLAKRQALALPSTTNIRVTGSPLAAPAAMLDDAPPSLADDINNTPLAARPKLEGDSAAPQMHSATSPSSALSTLAAFPSESISIQQRNEYRSTSSLQAPSSFDYAHVDAGFVNMSELEAESARV